MNVVELRVEEVTAALQTGGDGMNETGQGHEHRKGPGHWRFYGRREERAWLTERLGLDQEPFVDPDMALAIGGRRGIGKTELLREVFRRHKQEATGSQRRRLLMVDLPVRDQDEDHVEAIIEAMVNHDMEDLLGTLPPRRSHQNSGLWGGIIIRHLLKHGVIVGLDEFHHARPSGLPSALKKIIDDQRSTTTPAEKRVSGRLVLMGSHQQQFQDMFDKSQPLHTRVYIERTLQPWPFDAIWEMARDQGWDRQPERLHTLWTAYGGTPLLWRDLALAPDPLRQWPAPKGQTAVRERSWLQAWLRFEQEAIRQDPRRAWNNKTVIELAEPLSSTLIALGRQKSAGHMMPAAVIIKKLRARERDSGQEPGRLPRPHILDERLHDLQSDTGRVCGRNQLTGLHADDRSHVWAIDDHPTLFQIRVLGRTADGESSFLSGPERVADGAMKRLKDLEGDMLERLVVQWLAAHPQHINSVWGALPPGGRDHVADIDGLALLGWDEPVRPQAHMLVCVNAKRTSRDHKIEDFQKIIDRFMQGADQNSDIQVLQTLPRHHLFVSPVMQPDDRQRLEADGHLAFDWPTMAAEMQKGWPRLRALMPPEPEPAAEETPDTDDGPKP